VRALVIMAESTISQLITDPTNIWDINYIGGSTKKQARKKNNIARVDFLLESYPFRIISKIKQMD
jgi:hypothetical protein